MKFKTRIKKIFNVIIGLGVAQAFFWINDFDTKLFKKVTKQYWLHGDLWKCARCNNPLEKLKEKRCDNCGQPINWRKI